MLFNGLLNFYHNDVFWADPRGNYVLALRPVGGSAASRLCDLTALRGARRSAGAMLLAEPRLGRGRSAAGRLLPILQIPLSGCICRALSAFLIFQRLCGRTPALRVQGRNLCNDTLARRSGLPERNLS